jgi:hypothetical protein
MKFRKEVQEQFKKAGWYEGRNLQKKFDKIKNFKELPSFLKEFLYEYGDLLVQTYDPEKKFNATFNLKAVPRKKLKIRSYLAGPNLPGNILTFPVGEYQQSHYPYTIECDKMGAIYLIGEFPAKFETNFKEGIEKIMMEDHSDSLDWDEQNKVWIKNE